MEVLANGNRDTSGRNDSGGKEIGGRNEDPEIGGRKAGGAASESGKGTQGKGGEAGTGETGARIEAGTRGAGGTGGVSRGPYKCRNCGQAGHKGTECPYPKDGKQTVAGVITSAAKQRKEIETENAEKKTAADAAVIEAQKELVLASCEMAFGWWGIALWDYEHGNQKPSAEEESALGKRAARCSNAAWNLCAAYGWVGPEFAKVLATIAFVGAVGGAYVLPTARAMAKKSKEEKRLNEVKPPE